MKKLISLLVLLQWNIGFGQIQFEFEEESPFVGWNYPKGSYSSALEIDSGYLLAGRGGLRHTILLKLNQEGIVEDSVVYESVDSTQIFIFQIYEKSNSYVTIGRKYAHYDTDTTYNFRKAVYSKDLELISEKQIPIPFANNSSVIDFTWNGGDTVLYTFYDDGIRHIGWLIPETGEIFEKEFSHAALQEIVRRPKKPGYLLAGKSLYLADEQFNKTALHSVGFTTKNPFTGLDVEYFNDSTFMFSTVVKSAHQSPYFDEGFDGVFVGTASDSSLEILTWDTISIPANSNWIISPFQKYLARSSDTTFIVAGETMPYSGNHNGLFCAKYTTDMERLYSHVYHMDNNRNYYIDLIATSDGGCLLYGYVTDYYHEINFYALKIGPDGLVTGETSIPVGKSPIKVYPNPTSDVIRFDMQGESKVMDFELMDMQGQTVLRQKVSSSEEISTRHLPQGIYAYRILNKKGEMMYSGKMVKE